MERFLNPEEYYDLSMKHEHIIYRYCNLKGPDVTSFGENLTVSFLPGDNTSKQELLAACTVKCTSSAGTFLIGRVCRHKINIIFKFNLLIVLLKLC